MFAQFNYENAPLIVVTLDTNIGNKDELDLFLKEWKQSYEQNNSYRYIFDSRKCGMINIKYTYLFAKFLSKLKSESVKYLDDVYVVIKSPWIKGLLEFVFTLQSPIAPVYITESLKIAKKIYYRTINNEDISDLNYKYIPCVKN
jgi:hypothetical protein